MTARQAQFPLLATFALIGLTAVAIFAPLASATSSKRSAAAESTAASQDEARHQALSTLVANHDAAARRAIDASRELTQDTAAKPAAATLAGSELLRPAKDSAARPATRTMRMLVTAYCPCKKCCGASAQGITASGKTVAYNQGRFVAADKLVLKFGTRLMIPGYHNESPVEVIDTGSAIKGNRIDVYYPDHQTALEWGKRWVDVIVVE